MTRMGLKIAVCAFWIVAWALAARAAGLEGHEHWVESNGFKLRIWEKLVGEPAGKPVIVLAHGSASSGQVSFDLQVPGKPSYSLMDCLAAEGFDVFAPDMRGFGRSTHPEAGVTTADAAEDLGTAVGFVLKLRSQSRAGLLAWSWGTQYAGLFVAAHPEKVARYVSFAQMHVNSPDLTRRRAKLDDYRKAPYITIPEAGWKTRFVSLTPEFATDPGVIDAFAKAASSSEPATPTGPQIDMLTRMPMLDPRAITVPVMIIHGEYDDVAGIDGLMPFFRDLPNPEKKYVVVPAAGHMMQFQIGHAIFQREVAAFFKPMQ